MEGKIFKASNDAQVLVQGDGKIKIAGGYQQSVLMTLEEATKVAVALLGAISHVTKENTKGMSKLPDAIKEVKGAQKESSTVLARFDKLLDD